MTSAEIVRCTLGFAKPERIARSFHDSDIVWASYDVASPATDWYETGGGRWERIDEWGNTWARLDSTSKGEVAKGVLEALDEYENIQFPDFSDATSYACVGELRARLPEKYLLGILPGFAFNIVRKLRRMDQYLLDLLMVPEHIHALHDRIDMLLKDMIANYAAQGVDAVIFFEDWGTQQQLLIDPGLWREEFGPRFHKLCAAARDASVNVWMHSCGNLAAIIPDLVAAGIAVLQFDQPELYGIDALAAFQDKTPITFWCPVDIQKTLPTGDEALIRARAAELVEKLWHGGGFIAGYYEDDASIGVDPAWQEFACNAFIKYDVLQ